MSFAVEWMWYVAAALPPVLAIIFAVNLTRRRRSVERMGDADQLRKMVKSFSPRRRTLKIVILIAAVTLLAFALARPQIEGESSWRQRGIDVALVVDYSKSMMASDVAPSRLDRALVEVDGLLDELSGDRVALVAFAGAAIHFPVTHDHSAARLLYSGLSPLDMAPGSHVGEGIRVARCILRPDLLEEPDCRRIGGRGQGGAPLTADQAPTRVTSSVVADRARAMVIFTDGEDTEGRARKEIERAVALGIEVFVVGVGTVAGELVPEFGGDGQRIGWKKGDDGESFVTTRLDQAGLKELAELSGAANYFWLGPRRFRTEDLVAQLASLKRGDLDKRVIRHPREIYQWFLFPAFLLLLLEACLRERRL